MAGVGSPLSEYVLISHGTHKPFSCQNDQNRVVWAQDCLSVLTTKIEGRMKSLSVIGNRVPLVSAFNSEMEV